MSFTVVDISTTFTITPVGYDGFQLEWTLPGGNWNEQILLRSSFGTPQSIYEGDGTILVDQLEQATPQAYSTSYLDTGLRPGRFYYYSLLVFDTTLDEFVLAGFCQGLVLTYYGFGVTYASWMPDWYLNQDQSFATPAQPQGPLERFLNLLGYEMDWIRSEIESLFLLTDIDLASGAMLPYIGGNLGLDYEPALGMSQSRILIKNAVFLYKNRGTNAGIAAAASAYTGFGCKVTIGPNLEIQLDDSAFDSFGASTYYAGHWLPSSGTSELNISVPFGNTGSVTITPPGGTTYLVVLTNPSDPYLSLSVIGIGSSFSYSSVGFAGPGTFLYTVSGHGDSSYTFSWDNSDVYCVPTSIQVIAFSTAVSVMQTVAADFYELPGIITPHTLYNPAPAYTDPSIAGYLPINNQNTMVLTAQGVFSMTTCNTTTATVLGIPVPQLATPPIFVLSGYFLPVGVSPTNRTFYAQIDWYGLDGHLILSVLGTPVTEVNGVWTRVHVNSSPPAGAYYAGRTFKSTAPLTGDLHLFDAEQIEVNSQATPGPSSWQPPRDIKINLLPVRQNLITNPVGLGGMFGWSVTGGTMVPSSLMATPPHIAWPAETSSGFVVTESRTYSSIAGGALYGAAIPGSAYFGGGAFSGFGQLIESLVFSTIVPVNAGISYSFSTYMQAATTSRQIQLSVTFFNAHGALVPSPAFTATLNSPIVAGNQYSSITINALPFTVYSGQNFILNPAGSPAQQVQASATVSAGATSIPVVTFVANSNYQVGTNIAFSQALFNDVVGSFTRGSHINILAPATSTQALIQITIIGASNGEIHYFGAPIFEPLPYLLPYFDANLHPTADYLWEGTPNQSVSDYYPNLTGKFSRLIAIMPDYIPIGATFSLLVGANALLNANLLG